MKEDFIAFETAKLAKEKGFENKHPHKLRRDYYNHLGKLNGDVTKYLKAFCNNEDTSEYLTIDAPTQSLLQKWLREVHDIHVIIVSGGENGLPSYDYCVMVNRINHNLDDGDYSYEEALEKGLQGALKLI